MESTICNFESGPYAGDADFEVCRRIHRRYGTTYYFATRFFPQAIRRRTHALYAFVRLPDEWVDNPDCGPSETRTRLRNFRQELVEGVQGSRPESGVLRAFCDVVSECAIPLEEPLRFLDSMEQDLTTSRYATYEDLRGYMRGSASAVGLMMCHVLSARVDPKALPHAMALGEAMQMTNFLRDIREDVLRQRIYLPLEHLSRFGVTEGELLEGQPGPGFKELLKFEIDHTRSLYRYADEGIQYLPPFSRKAILLASCLYAQILEKIEQSNYRVFEGRARTTSTEKLRAAAKIVLLPLS